MKSCLDCKDYKDCIGKPWYTYQEIRFCPYQIIWIIENWGPLEKGNWPDCPDGSRHIDPMIKTGFSNEAYFVKAVGIIAEVKKRLETTGEAGEALVDEIEDGNVTVIVEDGRIKFDGLSRPAYRALMYVKGKRRKLIDYRRWLRVVYYAPKTVKKHQFNSRA